MSIILVNYSHLKNLFMYQKKKEQCVIILVNYFSSQRDLVFVFLQKFLYYSYKSTNFNIINKLYFNGIFLYEHIYI